jgi:hypothetical protein
MIGMSNGMNVGDETALRKKHHTEQQDKKDWFNDLQIWKIQSILSF